ncbi:8011_t:CDS:2, partial [Funneliformis mosseae]
NRASLDLEDRNIDNIYNQRIVGATFLELTQEDLTGMRILLGPAKKIVKLIKEIQGAGTLKSPTSIVSIFVDNSNLFIKEKFTVGRLESAGTFDQKRNSHYLNQLHIDHGRLLSAVLNGRQMGSNLIIVGSRPPPNDSLWDQIVSQGYDVVVFDRNIENKEKKVDMELGASAMDVIWTRDPGIFVLVFGDGDYFPVVKRTLNHNWKEYPVISRNVPPHSILWIITINTLHMHKNKTPLGKIISLK